MTRDSISSGRSRRGGIVSDIPARRKYRSERKRPSWLATARSRLLAATNLTSTGRGRVDPRRVTTRSSMARNNVACMPSGSSPISSRNTVPPLAASNRPVRAEAAPVNAPLSVPKSSLCRRDSGSAAQLMPRNGPSERVECAWIALARTSLPTPVSPRSNTLIWVRAARAACS